MLPISHNVNPIINIAFPNPAIDAWQDNVTKHDIEVESSCSSDSDNPFILNGSFQQEETQKKLVSSSYKALFIGDLDLNVTEGLLTTIFGVYPSFISAKVCLNVYTGKSLGHGYLNFGNQIEARCAINNLNYTKILSKEIHLMPSMRNANNRTFRTSTLTIANIPLRNYAPTKRQLFETFRIYGDIMSCEIDLDSSVISIQFRQEFVAESLSYLFDDTILFGYLVSCSHIQNMDVKELMNFDEDVTEQNGGSDQLNREEGRHNSSNQVQILKIEANDSESCRASPEPLYFHVTIKNFPVLISERDLAKTPLNSSVFTISRHNNIGQAWVHVKHVSDRTLDLWKEIMHHQKFFGRRLNVHWNTESEITINPPPTRRVKLFNLFIACNSEFLKNLCSQEHIKYHKLEISSYDPITRTHTGYVDCKTTTDAQKLVSFLHNRILGGMRTNAVITEGL